MHSYLQKMVRARTQIYSLCSLKVFIVIYRIMEIVDEKKEHNLIAIAHDFSMNDAEEMTELGDDYFVF